MPAFTAKKGRPTVRGRPLDHPTGLAGRLDDDPAVVLAALRRFVAVGGTRTRLRQSRRSCEALSPVVNEVLPRGIPRGAWTGRGCMRLNRAVRVPFDDDAGARDDIGRPRLQSAMSASSLARVSAVNVDESNSNNGPRNVISLKQPISSTTTPAGVARATILVIRDAILVLVARGRRRGRRRRRCRRRRRRGRRRCGRRLVVAEVLAERDAVGARLVHQVADAGDAPALLVEAEQRVLVGDVVHEQRGLPARRRARRAGCCRCRRPAAAGRT